MKKYKGIKKAAAETKHLSHSGLVVEIAYDIAADTVTASTMTTGTFSRYNEDELVMLRTTVPMTMTEIKTEIENKLA